MPPRLDRGLCGLHSDWIALGHASDAGGFADRDPPGRFAGARQPEGEAQRVDMAAAHVQRAAVIGGGGSAEVADFIPVHRADQIIAILILQFSCVIMAVRHEPLTVVSVQDAVAPVGIRRVLHHQIAHQSHAFQRHIPELPGAVLSDHVLQFILFQPLPGAHLTAIAPGGAEAHAVGLQQHDLQSGLGSVQGGGQSGKPPRTNDAEICLHLALSRRIGTGGVAVAAYQEWGGNSPPTRSFAVRMSMDHPPALATSNPAFLTFS